MVYCWVYQYKNLKSINIWQSNKQERNCIVHFRPLFSCVLARLTKCTKQSRSCLQHCQVGLFTDLQSYPQIPSHTFSIPHDSPELLFDGPPTFQMLPTAYTSATMCRTPMWPFYHPYTHAIREDAYEPQSLITARTRPYIPCLRLKSLFLLRFNVYYVFSVLLFWTFFMNNVSRNLTQIFCIVCYII